MALSLYERETIINYNDADGTANIFTASPNVKKKLEKLGEVRASSGGWEVDVPKSWIKISKPKKVSEAQKNAARAALVKARAKNTSK